MEGWYIKERESEWLVCVCVCASIKKEGRGIVDLQIIKAVAVDYFYIL